MSNFNQCEKFYTHEIEEFFAAIACASSVDVTSCSQIDDECEKEVFIVFDDYDNQVFNEH